jgi:hypothetical protein
MVPVIPAGTWQDTPVLEDQGEPTAFAVAPNAAVSDSSSSSVPEDMNFQLFD